MASILILGGGFGGLAAAHELPTTTSTMVLPSCGTWSAHERSRPGTVLTVDGAEERLVSVLLTPTSSGAGGKETRSP